ncbi:flagellar hook-length control protein FliK [Paenibacillus xylaniclasticus]|uniref:flagellar hook-length control protein FliK n=1 Tax=Paenibacillus xylaniclasticus TaxID=588083 RepID=UPI000FDC5D82|nr:MULTISPECIES: flagellar hook-length control protein FliK [Paenibacillus]GFN31892.1 hypothetical protein PCURB6_21520 [Paenibacillus curdlanolyticus]
MDMTIVSAASASSAPSNTASSSTGNASKVTNGDSSFQKTLAGSLQSSNDAEAVSSVDAATRSSAPQAETGAAMTELSAEQLHFILGSLLVDLQNEDFSNEPDQGELQQQLQDFLDQLNAMITLLGGQQAQPLPVTPGHVVEDLKADVQQALIQLQAILGDEQAGYMRHGISLDVIGSQVKSMQQNFEIRQLLESAVNTDSDIEQSTELINKQTVSRVSDSQPEIEGIHNVPAADKASVMLNRLNQQAVSPHLLQLIASQQGEGEIETTQGASEEGLLELNVNTVSPNELRTSTVRAVSVTTPVSAQQFAETMADLMVNKFEVKTTAGMSEARLTLTPEHLGQVDVRISVQNGQLTALFVAESSIAKDMLDNQLAQLRSTLQSQGLNVEKLEVTQQQSIDSQMSQQHREGSGRQQPNNGITIGDQSESEEAAFEAELAQQSAIRELGYGRSINVKA